MPPNFDIKIPRREYTIKLMTSYADYLDEVSQRYDMSPSNLIQLALMWYQTIDELPGARESINGVKDAHRNAILGPKFKSTPPTQEEYDALLKKMEEESTNAGN